jgi:hypothetical protein
MDPLEKAKVRLEHWISHSVHHQEEYELFMEQLQEAGKSESAEQIKQMIALTEKTTECLKRALAAL